jgi:hypothetical protein
MKKKREKGKQTEKERVIQEWGHRLSLISIYCLIDGEDISAIGFVNFAEDSKLEGYQRIWCWGTSCAGGGEQSERFLFCIQKKEYNCYFYELICRTNFRLSRIMQKSANSVYQVIGGIPD